MEIMKYVINVKKEDKKNKEATQRKKQNKIKKKFLRRWI